MTETPFDLLHPAVQHHVVNSLGWRTLRLVQEASIEPIVRGEHVVVVAGTAGGKTEAALFPLLSRMLAEEWAGLSVLYVCPLKALLNNLHHRLTSFASLVGRRVGLWHGDIGPAERARLLADPPDILLTTPESLEAMLVSTRVAHDRWFAGLRAVVVDEIHAFAGDDRGWHLLAVLERVTRLAGRELQRVGLSATVGNPDQMLAWLTPTCSGVRTVVQVPVGGGGTVEVTVDFVGSLANAALVLSRLYRGEKRLVFVDSRARAEQLAVALREHGVTTFVSHGSLGVGERRDAERAFAEERDCVIVATSTLELGIDVGDLDRVIQIDAPSTVASFLQRLGRTGRRPASTRNTLFLATDDDALLGALAVVRLWRSGFVEPVVAPLAPLHLVAQQCLALVLQEGGVGRNRWAEWLGDPLVLGPDAAARVREITEHLVTSGYLHDDSGILSMGTEAEREFGRRNFLELLAVFTAPPMLSARHGAVEIGMVPDETLMVRPSGVSAGGPPVLLLAGRNWAVQHVDWARRVVQVEPAREEGIAKWWGGPQAMSSAIAGAIRDVLVGGEGSELLGEVQLSRRATERLAALRDLYRWVQPDATVVVTDERGRARWWTFAGWKANLWLAQVVAPLRTAVAAIDGLSIALDPGTSAHDVRRGLDAIDPTEIEVPEHALADAVQGLKFSSCLPAALAVEVVRTRLSPGSAVDAAVRAKVLNT